MKRIMVIFTGGTIGSRKRQGSIDTHSAAAYQLIDRYVKDGNRRNIRFDTMQPLNLLSENMVPGDWELLHKTIRGIDPSLYDGIILTHGTDTLPYTAAALSYCLYDYPLPIVVIASNYPLDDPRSKGYNNFVHALHFIHTRLPGVFVGFENNEGKALIHLGTRLRQSDPFTDDFESAYSAPFGYIENDRFIPVIHPVNPSMESIRADRSNPIENPRFSNEILFIHPHPGLDYDFYPLDKAKPKAILHHLYHSGTAAARTITGAGAFSLVDFARKCCELGTDLYICPIKRESNDLYQSSVLLLQAGVTPLTFITAEAALVKLMLAYGSFGSREQIRGWMSTSNLFYERLDGIRNRPD